MMWDFIQTQILGMKWLNTLIGELLLLGIFIAICTVGIIIVGYGFNVFQYLFI